MKKESMNKAINNNINNDDMLEDYSEVLTESHAVLIVEEPKAKN